MASADSIGTVIDVDSSASEAKVEVEVTEPPKKKMKSSAAWLQKK